MYDLLAETGEALVRLERAPEDPAALPYALGLVRRVREACGPLGLLGAEQLAGAAERALNRVGRGAPAVTPDLITGLLRALSQIEAAVAGFPHPGTAEIVGALGNVLPPSRPDASLPPTPLSARIV